MSNWYEKFKISMAEAIEHGWDLRACNTANAAQQAADLGRITRSQANEIQTMYTAWMAKWDEESTAVEAATREALARAGMLAEGEPAAPDYKVYQDMTTLAITLHAATAMAWHRSGGDLAVITRSGQNDEVIRRVVVRGAPQKIERSAEDENHTHCKHIAQELDAYVNGDVRRCPDCGEEIRRDWGEVGEAFKCPHCGEISDPGDWEYLGIYDFLADSYDIEYRVSGRARDSLRSVCIMVACGGPNIYLDTESKNVELYWWSERARYPLSDEAVEALDEWAEEMWCCL